LRCMAARDARLLRVAVKGGIMKAAHSPHGGPRRCTPIVISTSLGSSTPKPQPALPQPLLPTVPILPPETIAVLRHLRRVVSPTIIGPEGAMPVDLPTAAPMDDAEGRYPRGVDRRLLDWVRSEETDILCQYDDCEFDVEVRLTDVGPICLDHYLARPTCEVPGCHRPQADPRRGKRYRGIYHCWHHDSDPAAEATTQAWARWAVDRRAPFALDAV
jgi:hypothetical protein